tara:strand:- start:1617 stop:2369 length:753 start_codon:yes stop_codon:yes gene_type:complete
MEIYLPLIFFLIALIYSSVGFGGGSSYLAVLSLILNDIYLIRSSALILNLCVVGLATISHWRNKTFDFSSFWPFVILSFPTAFIAAQWKLSSKSFFIILGSALVLAAISMFFKYLNPDSSKKKIPKSLKTLFGAGVGFLSGLSGIGGGIYLSPLLHLFSWENSKKIASLASFFILVNSTAGIAGLIFASNFKFDSSISLHLILAVLIGGGLGNYLGNQKVNNKILALLTALLVLYAGSKLLLWHIFTLRI